MRLIVAEELSDVGTFRRGRSKTDSSTPAGKISKKGKKTNRNTGAHIRSLKVIIRPYYDQNELSTNSSLDYIAATRETPARKDR